MKYSSRNIVFILSLITIVNFGWSQSKLYILCQQTKEPIPYASLSWNDGKSGKIANEGGEINLQALPTKILVSATGFKDSIFHFNERDLNNITLHLSPSNFTLPEITVRPSKIRKRTIKVKSKNKSSTGSTNEIYKFCIGSSIRIEKTSEIKSVKFYVYGVGLYHPHKVRLRILKQDDLMYPSYDVLKDFIELKPTKKGWVTLDLTHLHLTVDSGYYLFALEWLLVDEVELDLIQQIPGNLNNTLWIRTYKIDSSRSDNIWHKRGDHPWRLMEFEDNPYVFAPWMRIDIVEYE